MIFHWQWKALWLLLLLWGGVLPGCVFEGSPGELNSFRYGNSHIGRKRFAVTAELSRIAAGA